MSETTPESIKEISQSLFETLGVRDGRKAARLVRHINELENENAALRTALKDGVEYFEADYLGEEAAKMVKGWEDLLEATT